MLGLWSGVFRKTPGAGQHFLHELRTHRNQWAHQEPFSDDDAYRAIDTAHRVLTAVSAEQAADVDRLKTEQRNVRFAEVGGAARGPLRHGVPRARREPRGAGPGADFKGAERPRAPTSSGRRRWPGQGGLGRIRQPTANGSQRRRRAHELPSSGRATSTASGGRIGRGTDHATVRRPAPDTGRTERSRPNCAGRLRSSGTGAEMSDRDASRCRKGVRSTLVLSRDARRSSTERAGDGMPT